MAFPDDGPSTQQGLQPSKPATNQPTTDPLQPVYSPEAVVGEVNQKYSVWRGIKRPHEIKWFINNAMLAGLTGIRWNDSLAQIENIPQPQYKRERPSINKILPKFRTRKAKFLKSRYAPIVVPASSDKEDKLNATASQLALEYASRKCKLESIYRRALNWSESCGKSFIAVHWDANSTAKVKDEATGAVTEQQLGDIRFEAVSPFEILVPDIGIETIGDQHEYMRVRALPLEDLKLRYKDVAGIDDLKGDAGSEDLFQYQKQIASLSSKTSYGATGALADKSDKGLNFALLKELFQRPCYKYPQGRYIVTAGNLVLRYQEMLPYGFSTMANPYPMVEFTDIELPGQFWPTSIVEQLIGPQREYSDLRLQLYNHMRKQMHPKILVSAFSKFPENAWTDEAGEVIKVVTMPGMMEPKVIVPPPISSDIWQNFALVNDEMDIISGLPPGSGGEVSGTTSGFQVNLLQEATDALHAPDVRQHEAAYEELYGKARKIMAQGYEVPRLISMTGRAHIPDVIEFSKDNIDENAEIVVYTGSSLSNSPAVRTQQVIELWNAGILQDAVNPAEGQRKALTMLDTNGIGEFQQEKRRDEEKARLENLALEKGQFVKPPLPFDDHVIHYQIHTDQMKSPDFELTWDDAKHRELFAHTLLHMKYINPQQALQTAAELGFVELMPLLMPAPMPPPQTTYLDEPMMQPAVGGGPQPVPPPSGQPPAVGGPAQAPPPPPAPVQQPVQQPPPV